MKTTLWVPPAVSASGKSYIFVLKDTAIAPRTFLE
jgi:hypothetical protein